MPVHKVNERFYDPKTKRLKICLRCKICSKKRITRYDHYRERYLKKGLEIRCKECACVKFSGYRHSTGYIIRNYRSFPVKHWKILKEMCKKNGQIKEHMANYAIFLRRPLTCKEVIHHKNGIRNDNRIENLELFIVNGKTGGHCYGQREHDLVIENKNLRSIIETLQSKLCPQ